MSETKRNWRALLNKSRYKLESNGEVVDFVDAEAIGIQAYADGMFKSSELWSTRAQDPTFDVVKEYKKALNKLAEESEYHKGLISEK